MNKLNPVPFGHIEGDLDAELAKMGFTQQEITDLYGVWNPIHAWPKFEDAVMAAINTKGKDGEDNVVRFKCTGFVPGESDSFGPLTRGCKIEYEDGLKVCAYYG